MYYTIHETHCCETASFDKAFFVEVSEDGCALCIVHEVDIFVTMNALLDKAEDIIQYTLWSSE